MEKEMTNIGKSALITGVTGQDGAYLTKYLLDKGYKVYGTYRRLSTPNFWRLQSLGVFNKINLIPCDIIDASSVTEAIQVSEATEVYNLAAQSFVGASFEQPIGTAEITGMATTRMLEAIRHTNPKIRFYQASTSELFGNGTQVAQSETSPFHPTSPYAAAKLYSYWMTKIYREGYGLFACNGILFNHESPLRGLEFVTRKISNAAAKIFLGLESEIVLGNLETKRDWGYAPEYVESMWLMLQKDQPDDYVVATGVAHSVQELVTKAFNAVGLNWKDHVKVDKKYFRPIDVNYLQGDYTKTAEKLGWKHKTTFDQLIELMVNEDVKRWQRYLKGEHFPWDAPNYQGEAKILTRSYKI